MGYTVLQSGWRVLCCNAAGFLAIEIDINAINALCQKKTKSKRLLRLLRYQ